jgi:hypothetical protein
MWRQLLSGLKRQGQQMARLLAAVARWLIALLGDAWLLVRPPLVFVANVLLALLLLFEEWGWRPLSNLLAQLARYRFWAQAELWIAGLPPYGALVALAIPSAILIPAKLFGVYLLALGHILSAAAVLVAAKIVSTALIARLFILTKPALMQIGWFKASYDAFLPWQQALFEWIRTSFVWRYGRVVKWRARNLLRRAWASVRPQLDAAWDRAEPRMLAAYYRFRLAAREAAARILLLGRRLARRMESLAGLRRR